MSCSVSEEGVIALGHFISFQFRQHGPFILVISVQLAANCQQGLFSSYCFFAGIFIKGSHEGHCTAQRY